MNNFEIVKIMDRNGKYKEDPNNRKGRVMELFPESIIIGKPLFLECVNPGFMKSMITSPVKKWEYTGDGIKITTHNSIYVLKEVQVRSAI